MRVAQSGIAVLAEIESDLVSLPELDQRPVFVAIVLECVFVLESVHSAVAVLVLGSAMLPAGKENTLSGNLATVLGIGTAGSGPGQLEPVLAVFAVPGKQAIELGFEFVSVFVKVCV